MDNYTVYMHISPSGKKYIGITYQTIENRWRNGNGYKTQMFWRAIEKYGWDNIEHIIIAKGLDKETAEWLEIELIRELDTTNTLYGYNVSTGGEGGNGCKRSEETRQKISENHTDNSGENNPFYRKHHSEETIQKLSELAQGKYCGENNPMYGKGFLLEGKNNGRAISVICLTTKRIFFTAREGAEFYNTHHQSVSKCCKGKRKSSGKLADGTKLVWRYLNYNHNKIYRIKEELEVA